MAAPEGSCYHVVSYRKIKEHVITGKMGNVLWIPDKLEGGGRQEITWQAGGRAHTECEPGLRVPLLEKGCSRCQIYSNCAVQASPGNNSLVVLMFRSSSQLRSQESPETNLHSAVREKELSTNSLGKVTKAHSC